jgi:hypothetical protein
VADLQDIDKPPNPLPSSDASNGTDGMNKIRVYDRPEKQPWRVLLLLLLVIAVLAALFWVVIQALQ